ncbi:uncharacterized protein A4U43_C08F33330 [Asparagus officinalis]|uniref:thioredoxin H4-1-like n=1 Tax=Asparagus officinalis TaxID=4686 RepID=UPI00098E510E|nr:thioredoxin H4-1-like [Asparagus officinalis]XP_020244488.1 thioredoxin H4-1-like [Asparagus officinalis]XP_020244489.1 thioredoxin H4-1-like [Asparagus officinalis]XP_020244490.1 thioredoxin H4-1-like [Asparagus officinalis]ONK61762.1 uncharacterized protein A4U43_C08F33330 [Asparagus officinalis]
MGNCTGKDTGPSDFDEKLHLCGGNVWYISDMESWAEKISEANKDGNVVLANFSADWCAPCKIISSWYADQSIKYPSLTFLTVDVDELSELSTSMDIRAVPTFFFLKGGNQLDKVFGANKSELEKKLAIFSRT